MPGADVVVILVNLVKYYSDVPMLLIEYVPPKSGGREGWHFLHRRRLRCQFA
jgi:hypothetical protein